ncbi:MAG: hypothetical protein KA257_01230 [Opitutaceae bacterium]|nr:hypothetical protein [Opitutaceae bacterium]MBP9912827.1 hypothetical protein [Opitutaceae bacterium]
MSSPTLHGEIESSRPLHAAGGKVSLVGWCLIAGQPAAPPIRLVTASHTLPMTARIARPDVASLLPGEPAAANSGFAIVGHLPAGLHHARFEVLLPDGTWQLFRQLTLAATAPPFTAALDEPLSTGTLRDRVKVGGWALDPAAPVREIFLRYGHRRIACVINQPRADVAHLFATLPHAARAGFTSADFLVAGHGPVRVEARLADGRTAIVPTGVTFSIATDENHGPELDLTAARIALTSDRSPRPSAPATPTAHPLNVLFILPGSFAANHALHVAALANELAHAGHACAVAVARDKATLCQLDRAAFHGLTYAEAEQNPGFANQRGPDIVHAWTPRENVRQLAARLRARHGARVVLHLEDNEQQILAMSLGKSTAELAQLSDAALERLVPPDLSHPRRSQEFLAQCDGVTVIMDRLREFVPARQPCLTLPPAADARWFYSRPLPTAFRAALHLPVDRIVLFYHGNVHAANAAEMRELYLAVLALNQSGVPVTLIRAGLDHADFLGDLAPVVAPFVLSLGLIRHHHLPPLMALADIFVQPGVPDAFNDYRFPSKLPEFFALGRPVILPRTNLGTTLRHGTDAYVLDRADAAGIAGAVRALHADPVLAEKLGRGAAAYAAAHFSWARSAAALASFYAALTSS